MQTTLSLNFTPATIFWRKSTTGINGRKKKQENKKSHDFLPDVFMTRFKCQSKLVLCCHSAMKTRSYFYAGLKF